MQSFIVPGHPVPHVRMTQRSKHTDPQASRYLAYKDEVGLRANLAGIETIDGMVAIIVDVFVRERKFDASNILKAIEDALNGIAYTDDWQVTDAHVRIHEHCEEEFVCVTLDALGEAPQWLTSSAPSPASSPPPLIAYPKGSIVRR